MHIHIQHTFVVHESEATQTKPKLTIQQKHSSTTVQIVHGTKTIVLQEKMLHEQSQMTLTTNIQYQNYEHNFSRNPNNVESCKSHKQNEEECMSM